MPTPYMREVYVHSPGTSAPNEQGFEMKVFGDPKRRVSDFEGIQLITVSEEAYRNTEVEECFEFPFELQLLEEEDR